jgi:hypothetical protein
MYTHEFLLHFLLRYHPTILTAHPFTDQLLHKSAYDELELSAQDQAAEPPEAL